MNESQSSKVKKQEILVLFFTVSYIMYKGFCVMLFFLYYIPVLETDRPDPALTQAEIKYVPEQM